MLKLNYIRSAPGFVKQKKKEEGDEDDDNEAVKHAFNSFTYTCGNSFGKMRFLFLFSFLFVSY